MNLFTAAQIPIVLFGIWYFTAYMTRSFPTLTGKRICLLIAHPDDEAMFFAPALLWLTRPELGNQVVILCLSSGDADGLGAVRKGELARSAVQLGVRSAERVVVLDDPAHFPDSMAARWDAQRIAHTLASYFAPDADSAAAAAANTTTAAKRTKAKTKASDAVAAASAATTAPTADIDVILTFDEGGVSGHPNHQSLYHGAVAFVKSLRHRYAGWENPVKLYTLTSTNVARKYTSMLDVVATITTCLWRRKEKGEFPTPLVMVSNFGDYRKAQAAMTTAHKSQMRWFRWGWIGISRYMIVNDLTKQKV